MKLRQNVSCGEKYLTAHVMNSAAFPASAADRHPNPLSFSREVINNANIAAEAAQLPQEFRKSPPLPVIKSSFK